MNELQDYKRFGFYVPLQKGVQEEDGDWVLQGPLSNPDEDLQGEHMSMAGLRKGLQTFEKLGQNVDWEHLYKATKDPAYLIGKGLEIFDAPHPKTGKSVPWLKTRLYKNKKIARHAIEHLESGGTLGYSVEGGAIQKSGSHIIESIIAMVTITPQPVVSENTGTVHRVAKSLTAAAENWDLAELPVCPDLMAPFTQEQFGLELGRIIAKSMAATGASPAAGPGFNAAEVEDLDGSGGSDKDCCPECKRARGLCRCRQIKKALAYQLAEELADYIPA